MMATTEYVTVCPSASAKVLHTLAAAADFLRDLIDAVPDSMMTEKLSYDDTGGKLLELEGRGPLFPCQDQEDVTDEEGWKPPLPVEVLHLATAPANQLALQMMVTKRPTRG